MASVTSLPSHLATCTKRLACCCINSNTVYWLASCHLWDECILCMHSWYLIGLHVGYIYVGLRWKHCVRQRYTTNRVHTFCRVALWRRATYEWTKLWKTWPVLEELHLESISHVGPIPMTDPWTPILLILIHTLHTRVFTYMRISRHMKMHT